ncbi:hypothetical protein EDB83DRAFT_2315063 [Lactarius deliciosus]|nr:hypothetical protein EDB83DRAFT_2315063 [Lactarius deliciosus]
MGGGGTGLAWPTWRGEHTVPPLANAGGVGRGTWGWAGVARAEEDWAVCAVPPLAAGRVGLGWCGPRGGVGAQSLLSRMRVRRGAWGWAGITCTEGDWGGYAVLHAPAGRGRGDMERWDVPSRAPFPHWAAQPRGKGKGWGAAGPRGHGGSDTGEGPARPLSACEGGGGGQCRGRSGVYPSSLVYLFPFPPVTTAMFARKGGHTMIRGVRALPPYLSHHVCMGPPPPGPSPSPLAAPPSVERGHTRAHPTFPCRPAPSLPGHGGLRTHPSPLWCRRCLPSPMCPALPAYARGGTVRPPLRAGHASPAPRAPPCPHMQEDGRRVQPHPAHARKGRDGAHSPVLLGTGDTCPAPRAPPHPARICERRDSAFTPLRGPCQPSPPTTCVRKGRVGSPPPPHGLRQPGVYAPCHTHAPLGMQEGWCAQPSPLCTGCATPALPGYTPRPRRGACKGEGCTHARTRRGYAV